jgi:hypothetical protein
MANNDRSPSTIAGRQSLRCGARSAPYHQSSRQALPRDQDPDVHSREQRALDSGHLPAPGVAIWSGLEHGEQDRSRSACRTHRSLEPMALPHAPTADVNERRQRWRARTRAAARPKSRNRTRTKNKRAKPRPLGRCSTQSKGAPTRSSGSAIGHRTARIQARNGPGWCPTAGLWGEV